MSVWSDISVKLEEGGKVVADKARELSRIANIRAQIVGCDNTIYKNYRELGKAYYEAHKDDLNSEYEDLMNIISDSQAKKADLLAKLDEMKKTDAAEDMPEDFVEIEEIQKAEEPFEEAYDELDDADDAEIEAAFIDEEE